MDDPFEDVFDFYEYPIACVQKRFQRISHPALSFYSSPIAKAAFPAVFISDSFHPDLHKPKVLGSKRNSRISATKDSCPAIVNSVQIVREKFSELVSA